MSEKVKELKILSNRFKQEVEDFRNMRKKINGKGEEGGELIADKESESEGKNKI